MRPIDGFEPRVGEIRAVRTFRVGPEGDLYPLHSDVPWRAGVNSATCIVDPDGRRDSRGQPEFGGQPHNQAHAAPDPDCACGIYAYGSEAAAAAEQPNARHVLAVVACWGRTIAGTLGIRAEHARIEALWMSGRVPRDLVAAVARRYPDTALFTSRSLMLQAHPPTLLDCYELPASRDASWARRSVWAAGAVVLSSLALHWGRPGLDAPMQVGALALLMGVAGVAAARLRGRSRSAAVMALLAAALWILAPAGGDVGAALVRGPLLGVALLGGIQRALIAREARRFPARIGADARQSHAAAGLWIRRQSLQ
jgi:hypothetical protein